MQTEELEATNATVGLTVVQWAGIAGGGQQEKIGVSGGVTAEEIE